ncbi:MAG: PilN domain-containing protein [Acidobacteria bacterium]|nr:PilN domain-containing protein [Acidobacteriota bacterium]
MIRINLLAIESHRTAGRGRMRRRVFAACGAVVILTGSVVGTRVCSVRRESDRLASAMASAEREVEDLAPVLEGVRDREAERSRLADRVAWLDARRRQQDEPVRLLDEVGRSLPDGAWLTELRQEAGTLVLRGRAASLTSVSDFVAELERAASFSAPVEVVDSQVDDRGNVGDPIRFELHAALHGPPGPTGAR